MSWETFEIPEIYDGWILEFNRETKEIKWRDFWVTEKLSKKKKQQIESLIIKLIDNDKQMYKSGSMRKRPRSPQIK